MSVGVTLSSSMTPGGERRTIGEMDARGPHERSRDSPMSERVQIQARSPCQPLKGERATWRGETEKKWLIVIHGNFGAGSGMSFLRSRIQNTSEGEDKI